MRYFVTTDLTHAISIIDAPNAISAVKQYFGIRDSVMFADWEELKRFIYTSYDANVGVIYAPDTLTEYEDFNNRVDLYPNAMQKQGPEHNFWCAYIGIIDELGELSGFLKKRIRDGRGFLMLTAVERDKIAKELGDIFWYFTKMCRYFKFGLKQIILGNKSKLKSREVRGVLRGSGDDR
jgi:hypothetical protein